MRGLTRLLQITTEPVYRTKLLVFGLMGAVLVAISSAMTNKVFADTLLMLAVTIWGVALVQVLWDFVGGDPTTTRLTEIRRAMEDNRQSLTKSVSLLGDLIDGNIGIERIWATRRAWQSDPQLGIAAWHDIVCSGSCTRIVSNTLWANWMNNPQFRERFFRSIELGKRAHIVVYDPASDILRNRAADEGERHVKGALQMQVEIASTLRILSDVLTQWDNQTRERLQVRLTDVFPHPFQMVWVDAQMLIAVYLSGRSGGSAPTFQLTDPSVYFETFAGQFELIWKRARQVTDLQDYIDRFESADPNSV